MKKFLILLIVLVIGAVGEAKVVRNGNVFSTEQTSKQEIKTYLNWKDKDGIVYPIYITKKGDGTSKSTISSCYVKRISKKTGKEYKYYLPKEIQAQIKKELGM